MKTTFSSALACLAFLSFLGLASSIVIPPEDKINLEHAPCQNIRLEGQYVLRMDNCTSARFPETHVNLSVDLNDCLANYRGTLNKVDKDGGFGATCPKCTIGKRYMLECQCNTGNGNETMTSTFDMNYWRNIRISSDFGYHFELICANDWGIAEGQSGWNKRRGV
ncbi:hypothetical protein F5B22DRAFT_558798 [Xylaria bambusicola]|uniref:uncharacterized protein n=1 Tax=Xylaria bambusicola TaxID=326684 RepID=UPI0020079256|nr:uncharacterized protein F5B22DRAFT_558798 [Xylaria bambusicola]KAI0503242.1 hypothetical protein F5B22DRAFT_558798 [Xylaria bambusicola]